MTKSRSRLPLLGELELAVLEHLWSHGDADVAETHAAVGTKRGISLNTVGSTLERLYKKRLSSREKVSSAYRYRASLSREAFHAQRVVDAAGGLLALSERGMLAAFVDLVADSDRTALAELEKLIDAKRRELES